MWFDEAFFYQIYPLGFCGAPPENDGRLEHRLIQKMDWIPHLKKLGVDCVFFNPLFDADRHGYDTRDFFKLDCRLGSNEDFRDFVSAIHSAGMKVMLDGVFNHVGRGFWAFRDVLENKGNSAYKDWFKINFGGNSAYNDGFWYQPWEGHAELVELNLRNPEVVHHLLEAVAFWMDEFKIDGLRLDVAYMVDKDFMARLRDFALNKNPEFFLMGEMIHGDYKQIVNPRMLHSATNYGCYKSLYSAFNSMNMFEIGHSIYRQNSSEAWALYRGLNLVNFVDNHDVDRITSILSNPRQLPAVYTLMFGMPGMPTVYYGSEWGIEGKKGKGYSTDEAIRPALDTPVWNELTDHIAALARVRSSSKALCYGDFNIVVMTNGQLIFQRRFEDQRVLVAINASGEDYTAHFDAGCGQAQELLSGKLHDFGGGSLIPAYSGVIWLMEN